MQRGGRGYGLRHAAGAVNVRVEMEGGRPRRHGQLMRQRRRQRLPALLQARMTLARRLIQGCRRR